MDKLKLLWLAPQVAFKGKGIMTAWADELGKQGWDFTSYIEEADCVVFGSDSQLKPELIGQRPSIVYFWGWLPDRLLHPAFRDFAASQLNMMSQCTRILVPGLTVLEQLACFGLPGRVCMPGVDGRSLDMAKPGPRKQQVVYISRDGPHKNLGMLIQAMSLLQPSPPLVVMGPGNKESFGAEAKACRVPVEFLEPDDAEKATIIAQSSLLVHTSVYEGFGLPPVEALYLGTPVAVFSTPQMRWLLEEDVEYFSSVEGLAQIIYNSLTNPGPALQRAQHGQLRVRKTLTLEKACEQMWVNIHQSIKEELGRQIHEDPTNRDVIKRAYELEHKRNFAYGQADVAGYNGPMRFDVTWTRHWRAQHFLAELNNAGAKHVLDCGCGPIYPTIFARAGFEVTGFDVSEECLSQAQSIAEKWGVADKVKTKQGYAQVLPYENGTWDAVILGEVLEHVPDPEIVLAEAFRVVKVGGIIVCTVPYLTHHMDPMHIGPAQGGWDEAHLDALLSPYKGLVERLEKIAEANTEPSCFIFTIRKQMEPRRLGDAERVIFDRE